MSNTLEAEIATQVTAYAMLQWGVMEKLHRFGDAGRERVLSDFLVHVLRVPFREAFQPSFIQKFWEKAKRAASTLPDDPFELNRIYGKASLAIQKQSYEIHEADRINELLQKAGSPCRYFAGQLEPFLPYVIFGPAREVEFGPHRVWIIEREEARTPSAILPMIAFNLNTGMIAIRKEALRYIFASKWETADDDGMAWDSSLPGRLSQAWKSMTLKSYRSSSAGTPLEELMVDEMIETTVPHELSHFVMSKNEPPQRTGLRKMLSIQSYGHFLYTLHEILAEWMPPRDGTSGAIPYIAALGQGSAADRAKAVRLFYRYISDSWFLGNSQQEYLGSTTDLFIPTLLPAIRNNGDIDFGKLLKEASGHFAFFEVHLNRVIDGVIRIAESATFTKGGMDVAYATIALTQKRALLEGKHGAPVGEDTELFHRHFWANILKATEMYAPDTHRALREFLGDSLRTCKQELAKRVAPKAGTTDIRTILLKQSGEKILPIAKAA